ncbi:MAG: sigma-70 family RNA polymerase sigma factor [Polyangiaceae bacterium]
MGVPSPTETRDRAAFLDLVENIRPELHRYCARMTGSVVDGEDLLQDTLLKALVALPQPSEPAHVKAWVFRLAHNQAVDRFRSYELRMRAPLETADDPPDSGERGTPADEALIREQAVHAAVSRFLELPPLQRSCLILKDVLDYSLDEVADTLATSVPAVQAALHRARSKLSQLQRDAAEPALQTRQVSPTLARYATLFNARDWDALRAMLADDVRLDVVARFTKRGSSEVGSYFGRYARMSEWRVTPGWLDERAVLVVHRAADAAPQYFIEVSIEADRVVSIRDYHHVPYVAKEAQFTFC